MVITQQPTSYLQTATRANAAVPAQVAESEATPSDQVHFSPEIQDFNPEVPEGPRYGCNLPDFGQWNQPPASFSSLQDVATQPPMALATPSQSPVAVFDQFAFPGQPAQHGDQVAAVLGQSGGMDPSQFQQVRVLGLSRAAELLTVDGPESPSQRLNAYIEASSIGVYQSSSAAMQAVLDSGNEELRIFNQSSGMTGLTQFDRLRQSAVQFSEDGSPHLTPLGKVAFEALGLPTDDLGAEAMRNFVERFLHRNEEVLADSPAVAEARERHSALSEQLEQNGIAYVLSAGNDFGDAAYYSQLGIDVPPSADENLLINDHNLTVGSFDPRGTLDPRDDQQAWHSSRADQVDFLAQGVDVQADALGQSFSDLMGTSYAAPHVAGRLLGVLQANPEASVDEAVELLRQQARPDILGTDIPVVR
jgi:hypothetical protein